MIDELLKNNITPMVTLIHGDLPEGLNKYGGWLNESIVDHFNNYARKLYSELGDKVGYYKGIALHNSADVTIEEARRDGDGVKECQLDSDSQW